MFTEEYEDVPTVTYDTKFLFSSSSLTVLPEESFCVMSMSDVNVTLSVLDELVVAEISIGYLDETFIESTNIVDGSETEKFLSGVSLRSTTSFTPSELLMTDELKSEFVD